MFQLTAPHKPKTTAPRRAPCNDACIYARGPDCECKCQGLNHGKGWLDTHTLDLFTLTEG